MRIKLLKDVIEDTELYGFDFDTVLNAIPCGQGVGVLVKDLVGANIDSGNRAIIPTDGEQYYYIYGGSALTTREFEVIDED